jgi:hypothetical protein
MLTMYHLPILDDLADVSKDQAKGRRKTVQDWREMDREQRGLQIAAMAKIDRKGRGLDRSLTVR